MSHIYRTRYKLLIFHNEGLRVILKVKLRETKKNPMTFTAVTNVVESKMSHPLLSQDIIATLINSLFKEYL